MLLRSSRREGESRRARTPGLACDRHHVAGGAVQCYRVRDDENEGVLSERCEVHRYILPHVVDCYEPEPELRPVSARTRQGAPDGHLHRCPGPTRRRQGHERDRTPQGRREPRLDKRTRQDHDGLDEILRILAGEQRYRKGDRL